MYEKEIEELQEFSKSITQSNKKKQLRTYGNEEDLIDPWVGVKPHAKGGFVEKYLMAISLTERELDEVENDN